MRARHLIWLFPLALLVLAGCPADPPPPDSGPPNGRPDAGDDRDAGQPPGDAGDDRDAGQPPGDAGGDDAGTPGQDAGDAGSDAGAPETPEELAAWLCDLYLVGFQEQVRVYSGVATSAFSRCSIEDELPPLSTPIPAAFCAPGEAFYEVLLEATTGGRVAFDTEKLLRCVDTARAARGPIVTVADVETALPAMVETLFVEEDCREAITPLVAEGEPCRQHWDCPEGTLCEAAEIDGAELRCLAPAAVGESCAPVPQTTDESLAPSAPRTCASNAQCVNDVCVAALLEDQPCDPSAIEGNAATCQEGLFCNASSLCEPLRDVDGACTLPVQCAEGLRCGEGGTCEANALPAGVACEPGGLPCADTCSVCRPSTPGGVLQCLDRGAFGDACDELDHCREGLICDDVTGTCVLGGLLGASCAANPCSEGLLCSSSAVCELIVEYGGECDRDEVCRSGSCVAEVCVDGRFGDSCTSSSPCASPLACIITDGESDGGEPLGACAEAPGIGDPCDTAHDACLDSTCEDGICVAIGGPGNPCVAGRCGLSEYCTADDTCAALREPGAACSADEHCLSSLCLGSSGTCSAVPTDSCLSHSLQFLQVVSFGLLLPLGISAVRRRRRKRPARGTDA